MYIDQTLSNTLYLRRESILNELMDDRSLCDIIDDLAFYEGLDYYLAEQVVDLVASGE